MKANYEIREALKVARVKQWQLAAFVGCSEQTMYRKLRTELPEEERCQIIRAIKKLSEAV